MSGVKKLITERQTFIEKVVPFVHKLLNAEGTVLKHETHSAHMANSTTSVIAVSRKSTWSCNFREMRRWTASWCPRPRKQSYRTSIQKSRGGAEKIISIFLAKVLTSVVLCRSDYDPRDPIIALV